MNNVKWTLTVPIPFLLTDFRKWWFFTIVVLVSGDHFAASCKRKLDFDKHNLSIKVDIFLTNECDFVPRGSLPNQFVSFVRLSQPGGGSTFSTPNRSPFPMPRLLIHLVQRNLLLPDTYMTPLFADCIWSIIYLRKYIDVIPWLLVNTLTRTRLPHVRCSVR